MCAAGIETRRFWTAMFKQQIHIGNRKNAIIDAVDADQGARRASRIR